MTMYDDNDYDDGDDENGDADYDHINYALNNNTSTTVQHADNDV